MSRIPIRHDRNSSLAHKKGDNAFRATVAALRPSLHLKYRTIPCQSQATVSELNPGNTHPHRQDFAALGCHWPGATGSASADFAPASPPPHSPNPAPPPGPHHRGRNLSGTPPRALARHSPFPLQVPGEVPSRGTPSFVPGDTQLWQPPRETIRESQDSKIQKTQGHPSFGVRTAVRQLANSLPPNDFARIRAVSKNSC
jgi:hypothetical protein